MRRRFGTGYTGSRAGIVVAMILTAALTACGSDDDDHDPTPPPSDGDGGENPPPSSTGAVEIRTLSNRADLISGGDALVEIALPEGGSLEGLKVEVDGRDVTAAFAQRSDGRITGLVTGLAEGPNQIRASTANTKAAQLTVTNAPRSGPVLSGEQVEPFYCALPSPQPVNGDVPALNASGLSGQPDARCNIPTEYKLYYRTTAQGCSFAIPDPTANIGAIATEVPAAPTPPENSCFKPYAAGSSPEDMATTTTDEGVTVPFIVRVERGTMNRGIYDMAVLYDPNQPWTPTEPQPAWNGKVYVNFGASTGQPRRQVRPATAWSGSAEQLGRGYMVIANSMTDSARNSNRVLMSETVMMMKEHIGDTYGPIKFTLGTGCSGGSINSNMSASIFPGLLDGIVTSCTYPDSETTTLEVGDCVVLVEAYQKPEWLQLMNTGGSGGLTQDEVNAKKAAINGHVDQTACHGWYNAFGSNARAGVYNQRFVVDNATGAIVQNPVPTNNCELPNSAVYNPADPLGTAHLPRCNAWSWAESIWGRVPGSPAARETRDNVGVQYGLRALLEDAITGEEFVTLNEIVGGVDRDSSPTPSRTEADPQALEIAYRSGIVLSGRQLAKTAVIDLRGWDESALVSPSGGTPPATPIHHQWYSFAVRDRLIQEYGDADNQALWRFARTGLGAPGTTGLEAFIAMDQWLTDLKADTSDAPIEQKVRATRPDSTEDFCYLSDDPTQSIRVSNQAICDADPFLVPTLSPRQVAGGPRAENVLKCQLRPIDPAEHGGRLNGDQLSRLQAVFPSGVCDWTKPGVGQQTAVGPLSFQAGPGGQPLGAAPVSQPVQ
jgi:hypothetical protein